MVILICIVNSENIQLVILHLSVDYLFDILSLILEKLHLSASLMIFIITFNCYSCSESTSAFNHEALDLFIQNDWCFPSERRLFIWSPIKQ